VREWANQYWNGEGGWNSGRGGEGSQIESTGERELTLKELKAARRPEAQEWKKVGDGAKVEGGTEAFAETKEEVNNNHPKVLEEQDNLSDGGGGIELNDWAPVAEYEEGEKRIARPFGKVGDENGEEVGRLRPGQDKGDSRPLFTAEEEALADSPRVAIEDDAVDRAPLAALGTASDDEDETTSIDSTDSTPLNNDVVLVDHAANKIESDDKSRKDSSGGGEKAKLRQPKPIAGKPKKIGTGGKVVKPEEVLAPANGGDGHQAKVGASGNEKAGKVVQAEAGKRVGTGARPGAKGMGLERVGSGMGAERRREMWRRRRRDFGGK